MEQLTKVIDNPIVNLALRLLVGSVFVIAGIGKIIDPKHFATEIWNYHLIPMSMVNISALVLPWLELICGLLLISGVKLKANSIIIGGLLLVFILAGISAIARGLEINCGCFGKESEKKLDWYKILENTGLLIATVLLFISNPKSLVLSTETKESNVGLENAENTI
jgi:uncharacterized membrane protein YphA (DoxX/SURF4 family)